MNWLTVPSGITETCVGMRTLKFDPLFRTAMRGFHCGQKLTLHKQAGYICADRLFQSQESACKRAADHTFPTASSATTLSPRKGNNSCPQMKKRIVRTLIEEVVVDVAGQAGEIIAVIHWKGGVHTELRIPHRRRGFSRAHTPPEIVDAVRVLVRICSMTRLPAY